ncbi:MAG TPA: glycosyltransferase family 2 protein [Thermoplasmata archaeon]|nr:glycosyltransferase family 2 protein [Thermoplasmata archaeon]
MEAPKISIIIPTMNEEASIGQVLDQVAAAMAGHGSHEVLVVDTDSHDRTVEIARGKGARVIAEPRRGYGRAYKTGFAAARGDVLVTLDADLTYPADRIPEFVRLIDQEGADFVSGNRLAHLGEGVMSGMHRLGNRMLTTAARWLYRFPIRDSQSGMWGIRRSVLPRLEVVHDGMAFSEELKLEAIRKGLRFQEIPIEYGPRIGEKKIRSVRDAAENMVWLFRKRFGWVPRAPKA